MFDQKEYASKKSLQLSYILFHSILVKTIFSYHFHNGFSVKISFGENTEMISKTGKNITKRE